MKHLVKLQNKVDAWFSSDPFKADSAQLQTKDSWSES